MNKIIALNLDKPKEINTLKYENVELVIDQKGAKILELKINDNNVLFYNPKDIKHSGIPICFPIFGAMSEPLKIEDNEYKMNQHGFARDMDFKVEKKTKDSITYMLTSNEETLEQFPFNFKLSVTYTIEKNALKINAKIEHLKAKNALSTQDMPAVLAFHPCFAVNDPNNVYFFTNGSKYYDNLSPDNKNSFTKISNIKDAKELKNYAPNCYQILENPDLSIIDHKLPFTYLLPGRKDSLLKISYENFPYLTVWRAKKDVEYICVEPATSLKNAMVETVNQNKDKKIVTIPKGQKKQFELKIEVVPNNL
jgi:galactose mutarotase-like enzyme